MALRVAIAGCGFAGLTAIKILSCFKKEIELTVIDRKKNFDFLPLLPDALGRAIPIEFLSFPIFKLSKKYGFDFINDEVTALDLSNNEISTLQKKIKYDYLIIATGSETNFYGNESARKYAYKLDDTADAKKIISALENNKFDSYIISGAGYTGVEVATNLSVYFKKKALRKKIIIVEKAPKILWPLPEWIKQYTLANLKRLKIDIILNSVVNKIEQEKLFVSGYGEFGKAMLIWTAGVKIADFVNDIDAEKNLQGRIKVGAHLRLNENCFVAGDAANFIYKGVPLRMAVQFAITQSNVCAKNILNIIHKKGLRKYRPLDLGYIIPMADNSSCGKVFGLNIKGMLATSLHYLMCAYRWYGVKNKIGLIRTLMRKWVEKSQKNME